MNKVFLAIPELPKGEHTVCVRGVDVGKSKAGAPRVWCPLEILDGPTAGERFAKVQMLNSPRSIEQCLQDWRNVGVRVQTPDDLCSHMEEILSMRIIVNVVHGDRPACYFVRRAPDDTEPSNVGSIVFDDPPVLTAEHPPQLITVHRTAEEIKILVDAIKAFCNWGPTPIDNPKFHHWLDESSKEIFRWANRLQSTS